MISLLIFGMIFWALRPGRPPRFNDYLHYISSGDASREDDAYYFAFERISHDIHTVWKTIQRQSISLFLGWASARWYWLILLSYPEFRRFKMLFRRLRWWGAPLRQGLSRRHGRPLSVGYACLPICIYRCRRCWGHSMLQCIARFVMYVLHMSGYRRAGFHFAHARYFLLMRLRLILLRSHDASRYHFSPLQRLNTFSPAELYDADWGDAWFTPQSFEPPRHWTDITNFSLAKIGHFAGRQALSLSTSCRMPDRRRHFASLPPIFSSRAVGEWLSAFGFIHSSLIFADELLRLHMIFRFARVMSPPNPSLISSRAMHLHLRFSRHRVAAALSPMADWHMKRCDIDALIYCWLRIRAIYASLFRVSYCRAVLALLFRRGSLVCTHYFTSFIFIWFRLRYARVIFDFRDII